MALTTASTVAGRPLTGQVALVTGGGRGIGRAIAVALGAAGASVAALARTSGEVDETALLVAGMGAPSLAVTADVTDGDAVRTAVAAIADRLGEVDLLVNNAGTNRVFGPVWEVDAGAWWGDVTVNLLGPLLCSQAVLPAMLARGSGRIVNIGSGAAGRPGRYNSSYAVSKAALVRLTDSVAAETRGTGVSVFVLGPGAVNTKITELLRTSPDAQRWIGDSVAGLSYIAPTVAADAVVELARGLGDELSGRWIDAADGVAATASHAAAIADGDLLQLRRVKP